MPKRQQPKKALVLKENFLDITGLIRSIQRAEGNPDCFQRAAHGYCNQLGCIWRGYCIDNPQQLLNAGGTHEEK